MLLGGFRVVNEANFETLGKFEKRSDAVLFKKLKERTR